MSSTPLNPARLAVESAAIFLSVFLAFAADQWRDDANDRERAQDALNLVRVELEQNLVELQSAIGTRQEMFEQYNDGLRQLIDDNEYPYDLPSVIMPEITTIAYELATDSSAVAKVDPDQLVIIARAYEALEGVRRNEVFLSNRNAQIRYRDGEQYLSGHVFYLSSAIRLEPLAVRHIEAALTALDA
ncbi:MAG: hypothetical protein AAF583_07455 [Pseudomonadota bacterium]